MDALRKAEQQKQVLSEPKQPAQQEPAAGPGLELVPHPHEEKRPPGPGVAAAAVQAATSGTAGDRLPELPKRLEELDEQFMAHAPAQTARRPSPATSPPATAPTHPDVAADTARANARLLFEAKQPVPENRRNFLIIIGLLTLVAAGGIGGYVWWELQPKGGLVTLNAPVTSSAPVAVPATPIAAPAPAPTAAPVAPTTAETSQAAVPPVPTFAAPSSSQAASAPGAETNMPVIARKPAVAVPQPSSVAEPESPIRLTRKQQAVDPTLEQAWQAFNRGEFALAQVAWQRALDIDSRNADALHGMAAIALQESRSGDAAGYYLRALEANPKDPLALAGLVSLKTSGDPRQTESRLKNLLAEQPESPYLNFALGNIYAQDQRWPEAQQAYFKAHATDPANPDYLFNLAVSLDQMHKAGLALQYYNQALAAAELRTAGFDTTQVMQRLKVLQAERRD